MLLLFIFPCAPFFCVPKRNFVGYFRSTHVSLHIFQHLNDKIVKHFASTTYSHIYLYGFYVLSTHSENSKCTEWLFKDWDNQTGAKEPLIVSVYMSQHSAPLNDVHFFPYKINTISVKNEDKPYFLCFFFNFIEKIN